MQQSTLAKLAQKAAQQAHTSSGDAAAGEKGQQEPGKDSKLGFWKSGAPKNPELHGHMLTNHELEPLNSVQCLEAKQRDPTIKCDGKEFVPGDSNSGVNAGNYPFWWDEECHGRGERFCDPDSLMSEQQHEDLAKLMKDLRDKHKVTCGPQIQHDPVDMWNYAPFYLGVALVQGWPLHEADPDSLNAFGKILMGRWNMTYMWDGPSPSYARCPLSAMLMILPDRRQAHLSSSSCMFICPEKGGPETVITALVELDTNGVFSAVSQAVEKVYEVLDKTTPQHVMPWTPDELTAGTWKSWQWRPYTGRPRPWAYVSLEGHIWDWAQRILFVVACLLLGASLLTACTVCYMAPGVAKELNKGIV